jgi:hypothetical protein
MGDKTSQGQALRLVSSFATDTRWGDLNPHDLQRFLELSARERGNRFTQFLWNQFSQVDPNPLGSMKLMINRGRFNPIEFLGEGWKIISEETDKVSATITQLDLSQVQQVTKLVDGEAYISGEERLRRLKSSNYIRLDADIFFNFWENQHLIPSQWKVLINGRPRCVYFHGTVFERTHGLRYVLYLYWDGSWKWSTSWLDDTFHLYHPSAVLKS